MLNLQASFPGKNQQPFQGEYTYATHLAKQSRRSWSFRKPETDFSLPIVWFTLGGVDWSNSASIRNASENDLSATLEPYAKRRQW